MTDQVEQITGVIGDPASWKTVDLTGSADDPLVNVPAGLPGVTVRMRRSQAIAQGLWREEKQAPPARNKMRGRQGDKGTRGEGDKGRGGAG